MNDIPDLAKVRETLESAQEILIVSHEHPTFDSIGSSLALFLGLTSLGKRVTIACPDPITVGLSNFIGANKVSTAIGKKNFIVSLDYVEGSIEKVSYNIEGNKFNLIIEPRAGFPSFSQDKVHFSEASGDPGVIFVVDTIHLGGLKHIYEEHRELFADKTVINIDRHGNNSNFGQINIIDQTASSTAEVIAQLLSQMGIQLTKDIATNLLNAVYSATSNFLVPNISANTFELAAVCVKAGGTRFNPPPMPDNWPAPGQMPRMPRPVGMGMPPRSIPRPMPRPPVQYPYAAPADLQSTQGDSQQSTRVSPVGSPQTSPVIQTEQPLQPQSDAPKAANGTPNKPSVQAPADWLKPKIFKSSNSS